MIGLLGLALLAAPFISHRHHPMSFLAYWVGILVWLGWIVLLALGDAWVSQQHLRRQARLELEGIHRRRQVLASGERAEQNGHDPDSAAPR